VLNDDWLDHQRLELENDLIAAHLLTTGQVPAAQFLGEQDTPAEPTLSPSPFITPQE
jgi:hypothetical protein